MENRNLVQMRKEAGYRSGREFSHALGVSTSSYSRYEAQPEAMPLPAAWKVADFLGCSIDEVVGRVELGSTGANGSVQLAYDALSEDGRALVDAALAYATRRDELAAAKADDAKARREAAIVASVEEAMYGAMAQDESLVPESPEDSRSAFEDFLRECLHVSFFRRIAGGEPETLGRVSLDGVRLGRTVDEREELLAELDEMLASERTVEGVVDRLMESYDGTHSDERYGGIRFVEYSSDR